MNTDTTAYNGSLSLDRIGGNDIGANSGSNLLTEELMSDVSKNSNVVKQYSPADSCFCKMFAVKLKIQISSIYKLYAGKLLCVVPLMSKYQKDS